MKSSSRALWGSQAAAHSDGIDHGKTLDQHLEALRLHSMPWPSSSQGSTSFSLPKPRHIETS